MRLKHQIIADLIIILGKNDLLSSHSIINEIFLPCYEIATSNRDKLTLSAVIKSLPQHHIYFHGEMGQLNSVVIIKEVLLKMLSEKVSHSEVDFIFQQYNLSDWIYKSINKTDDARVC